MCCTDDREDQDPPEDSPSTLQQQSAQQRCVDIAAVKCAGARWIDVEGVASEETSDASAREAPSTSGRRLQCRQVLKKHQAN